MCADLKEKKSLSCPTLVIRWKIEPVCLIDTMLKYSVKYDQRLDYIEYDDLVAQTRELLYKVLNLHFRTTWDRDHGYPLVIYV